MKNWSLIILCIAAFTQAGCITPQLSSPKVAIIQTKTFAGDSNVYCDADNKNEMILEGIPSSYFAWSESRNLFFMTRLQAINAANLRAQERNPNVWSP